MSPARREDLDRRLRKATETRIRRAQLKRDLRCGRVAFTELLREPPPWAARMLVMDVLLAVPRIWTRTATRAITAAGISPRLEIAELTKRQYLALLHHFRENHPGIWARWSVTGVLDAQVRGAALPTERIFA